VSKWVDEGENKVLDILFDATAVDATLYIGLYEDAAEPAEDITLATLTEQATGALGYARQPLTRGTNWTVVTDTATADQVTFTASGGVWGNQYGWFMTDALSGTVGNIFCVEDFSDGPYNVTDGDSVKVTAAITCS